MIAAGKLREQIKLNLQVAPVADGMGGFLPADELGGALPLVLNDSLVVWAAVEAQNAKDIQTNGKTVNVQPFKISIRYNELLNSVDSVSWNNLELNITSIVADVRKTEMVITAYYVNS